MTTSDTQFVLLDLGDLALEPPPPFNTQTPLSPLFPELPLLDLSHQDPIPSFNKQHTEQPHPTLERDPSLAPLLADDDICNTTTHMLATSDDIYNTTTHTGGTSSWTLVVRVRRNQLFQERAMEVEVAVVDVANHERVVTECPDLNFELKLNDGNNNLVLNALQPLTETTLRRGVWKGKVKSLKKTSNLAQKRSTIYAELTAEQQQQQVATVASRKTSVRLLCHRLGTSSKRVSSPTQHSSVTALDGIGEKSGKLLGEKGYKTVGELARLFGDQEKIDRLQSEIRCYRTKLSLTPIVKQAYGIVHQQRQSAVVQSDSHNTSNMTTAENDLPSSFPSV